MGLDIYFRKINGGQTATDGLEERRVNRNSEFKEVLNLAEGKDLDWLKKALTPFLWRWEMGKVNEQSNIADAMNVVREYYPTDQEDKWELMLPESGKNKYYFRKVNCLYGYALNNDLFEDEGCIALFDHETMVEILDRAKEILSQDTDEKKLEKGEELLPTQGGFFFGSTDYDNYYLTDIQEVVDKFEGMIAEWDDAYGVIFSW